MFNDTHRPFTPVLVSGKSHAAMRKIQMKPFAEGTFDYLSNLEGALKNGLFYISMIGLIVLGLSNLTHGLLSVELPTTKKIISGPAHVYGPALLKQIQVPSYHFESIEYRVGAMGDVELDRISEVSKKEFEDILLKSVPRNLRQRFELYIPLALGMAETYKVDPFWVISIMWTESHFDVFARSTVNAMGLMQVLPTTGHFLSKKLKRPVSKEYARLMIQHPRYNIEMGVYFLSRLLKKFNNNYRYATVSYNMGPSRIRRRLSLGLPVGVKNQYLDKVNRHYNLLTRIYKQKVMANPRPYKLTYVVANRHSGFVDKLITINFPKEAALLFAKSHGLFSVTYL
ncbi:MAG: lytic transglycosylase domain-containing protein [Bacteriovoracaceae bacterium]|nr:lytic transglycosylase domain-containing protein [Bacteriovoracaceae bacterium]